MSVIHNVLGLFPRGLVLRIKYLKQGLYRFLRSKDMLYTTKTYFVISKDKTHVFFGYYDISPFNVKTDEIIYLHLGESSEKVNIMKSSLNNLRQETKLAESSAWCWQQGVRLRWMPDNDREIIFNDFLDGAYLARIVNVDKGSERHVQAPLYDISSDGVWGLSVDFERLEAKRAGYGYSCRPYTEDGKDLLNEGIDLINIRENTKERVLTYQQIASVVGDSKIDYRNAYINHISFSPSGIRFLFFWIVITGNKHKASLIVYDFKEKKLIPVETEDVVSHYVWDGDEKIICTAFNDKSECYYYEYNITSGRKVKLNSGHLDEDGHPSIYNEKEILSDTYPDLNGFQQLFLAGRENGKMSLLTIYSNCMKEGPQRTDLHPRFNKDKTMVSFDANIDGFRKLYFINL